MKIISVRNVCQALPMTMEYLKKHGKIENSRAGKVIVAPQPMIIETTRPYERVLFNKVRDANPFFHIAEAIWMLAGRNDAMFLDRFIHDFSSRYAEKNGTLHDAYGWRWRKAFGMDQIQFVIDKLRQDPETRQCVIQMWDCSDYADLTGNWKSRPCNTHIFLRVNNGKLDLTTCCRSNDMLWGAHGANAVHFSVLQEYIAASLKIQIGTMYQLSNNAHVYLDALEKLNAKSMTELADNRYLMPKLEIEQLFIEPESVYCDIEIFLATMAQNSFPGQSLYFNDWFRSTLSPMMHAHYLFKKKSFKDAAMMAASIGSHDWRIACVEWLERRIKR